MNKQAVPDDYPIPVLGISAQSGTGKTTMLERLIPALVDLGLRVGTVKGSHHDFDIDTPGKDSHRHRMAGAGQVVLSSAFRSVWVGEGDGHTQPMLADQLAHFQTDSLDLVLVEGFRHARMPKIELHRAELQRPLLCAEDPLVIAVASNAVPVLPEAVDLLPLDDVPGLARYIQAWMSGPGVSARGL